MSEQKLQKKILDWLTKNGFYTVKTIVSNKKGVPDILACSPKGHFVAIEVKFGGNKASKLQDYNIAQIKERGGFAIVCWDLETLTIALHKEGIIEWKS